MDTNTEFLLVSEYFDSNYDIDNRILIDRTDNHLINNLNNFYENSFIQHKIDHLRSHTYSIYNSSIKFLSSPVTGLECDSSLSFLDNSYPGFTIEGWLYTEYFENNKVIFSIASTNEDYSEIALTTGTKIHVNRSEQDFGGGFLANLWNHWAVVGEPNTSNTEIHYDINIS